MSADNSNRPSVREIFLEAMDKPPGPEREACLSRACGSDAALRAKVESLLNHHRQDGFMGQPAGDVLQATLLVDPAASEKPGDRIGRYKLLEEIGEGGCGVVYMAEQEEPVRRKVALKIIKQGMDTKQVIARFEAERQALALMEHPNIAKVFDAGATETGRPYFVMELVRGIPMTRFCDEHRLSTPDRLKLFIEVCSAIQHAHQKGIIHRDIKPSNILVTTNDGAPVPKVIDFGIAKATSQLRLTDRTLFTAFSQFIGTPAYMSPEQAVMTSVDIDTRSDIYGLGVLLYELLTGETPLDAKKLMESGLDALCRSICEQEPLRPSTRLTQELSAAKLARGLAIPSQEEAAAESRRRARLREQIHLLRGDLDWVVMKCLEKDRTRRYETAHALAEDIQHYLRHEPVSAAPPSLAYRTRKFWRRHRPQIITAGLVSVLLLGLLASLWIYGRNARAQKAQWARETALPGIINLVQQQDFQAAFSLAQRAKAVIPRDPVLAQFWSRICAEYSITTIPPGASVSCRAYSKTNEPWQHLGQSPLTRVTLPQGIYRWKIEKEGFQTHECVVNHSFEVRLQSAAATRDMVWIGFTPDLPAGSAANKPTGVSTFLIDKYEVSNEQYQAFVDAGAYDKADYWTNLAFIRDERQLSWKEAVADFRDQTGRSGPATWSDGTFPPGQNRHPVSGVSWFEAVAYSRFIGKSLPTVSHWEAAACLYEAGVIVPFSNFGGLGTAPVGTHQGMGPTGLYDMAGNVKEWCLNATANSNKWHYILGGGWGEPTYLFTERDSRSPWNRSPQNGFRCVSVPSQDEAVLRLLAQPLPLLSWRSTSGLIPFSDEEFRMLRSFFEYDHTPLNAKIESSDTTSPFWLHEKITFNAAYGNDRVIAHLFLPKNGQPPYQTVVFFPGSSAITTETFRDLPFREVVEYFLLSGRALLFPVYYGMYERPATRGREWTIASMLKTPFAYQDWTICCVRDLGRSIDYLETRADIDHNKLAYYGLSHGAHLGPIMLALENRLTTGILALGGIAPIPQPRSFDTALYAQRVTVPILVVNGREDFLIPMNVGARPFYELLGSGDKKHSFYPGGHGEFGLFYNQVRQDVLAWLDAHLGPVR